VKSSFREKTTFFDEKYQTSPIPNIHWSIQIPLQQAIVLINYYSLVPKTFDPYKATNFFSFFHMILPSVQGTFPRRCSFDLVQANRQPHLTFFFIWPSLQSRE
jgi:hypothetical protein